MTDIYAQDWRKLPVVVFDTETTGLQAKTERIVEIGIVVFMDGEPIKVFNRLVNPQKKIPKAAEKVHGISDDKVSNKKLFTEIAKSLRSYFNKKGVIWCAFNDSFDRAFLAEEYKRSGVYVEVRPTIDPLIWARFMWKGMQNKLDNVAQRLRVDVPTEVLVKHKMNNLRHRAVYDAMLTGYCLYAMQERLPLTLRQTLYVQDYLYRLQALENPRFFSRNPEPTMPPEHGGGGDE